MTIRRTSLCLSMLLLLVLCFALLPAQALAARDFETPRELEVLSESPAPVFRSSGEITVYFTDSWHQGTPNVYYWGSNSIEWPGIAMTFDSQNDYGENIYRATIPADVDGIIFNANGLQTVDITEGIVDGAMWYPTNQMDEVGHNYVGYVESSQQPASEPSTQQPSEEPSELPTVEPQTEAYYLVGMMNEWSTDNAYKLTRLDESEVDEYILQNVQLTTDDSFKIVYSSDGSSYGMWYPEGTGNSFGENGEIVEDGTYDVYFRPNYDGGEDWFYNCIYVDGPLEEPTEPLTEQPTQQPSELPTEQPTNELTVYFVWPFEDTPYIYYWNYGPEWPGVVMTLSEYNDYGEPVYKATIPAGTTGIIFNSNGNQTVDITEGIADGAMWYTTGETDGYAYIVGRAEHPSEQPSEQPSEEPVFGEPDFTLPKDIKSIEASAFESADMSVVYIPDGCESIGVNAFRYCTSLRQIRIPASVTTIDQTAFTGCENVVVFGAENSRAQEIAEHYKDYGFVFVAETAMVNLE